MVRLLWCGAVVVLCVGLVEGGGGKGKDKVEKIRGALAFVTGDKIVIQYRENGSDVYRHVKPKEDKVKLVIDGNEVTIKDFKVKDWVEFDFVRKINTVLEVRLIPKTKKKKT